MQHRRGRPMSKFAWLPVVAAVLLAEPSGAQQLSPSQRAIAGWLSCVAKAAMRFAQGPDSAEFVIKAALLACPDEKENAMAEIQKEPHDYTQGPMTKFQQDQAEIYRIHAVLEQMDQLATELATRAIAEARSRSRQ
jgi:hypothetical protein